MTEYNRNVYSYHRGHPDLGAVGNERPRCRQAIINKGLTPWRDREGWWDGHTAQNAQGQHIFLTGGMEKQMRRMLAEGYWPFDGEPSEQVRKRSGTPNGPFTVVSATRKLQWPSEETSKTEPPKLAD